jgi:antitoxin (DNA-binding transcriptional repressor) of toxin-antitoxin stability system
VPATPHSISVQEAQGQLVQLVERVRAAHESVTLLGPHGQPVARLVTLLDRPRVRLGLAAGRYVIPDPSDELDAVIAREFDASGVVLDDAC